MRIFVFAFDGAAPAYILEKLRIILWNDKLTNIQYFYLFKTHN